MKRSILLMTLVAAVAALPRPARGALELMDYGPALHDRFHAGPDGAFIGSGLDFSGVGKVTFSPTGGSLNRWATMISPTFFLSSRHSHPRPGDEVTFLATNDPAGPSHTALVDDWIGYTLRTGDEESDLWLGRLAEPIPDAAGVARYPIRPSDDPSDYVGAEVFVYGLPDRVGRNTIGRIETVLLQDTMDTAHRTVVMVYDFSEAGVGADEAWLMPGDSGGPTFRLADGELTLVGIHYFSVAGYGQTLPPRSADSFVPAYFDQLSELVGGDGLTAAEPGGLLLWSIGVAVPIGWAVRRRLRRQGRF